MGPSELLLKNIKKILQFVTICNWFSNKLNYNFKTPGFLVQHCIILSNIFIENIYNKWHN